MEIPGTSAKPVSAAEPVSPLVAVRIRMRSLRPSFSMAQRISCGSTDSATSLNAAVGPWNSSSTYLSPTCFSGAISFTSNLFA